MPGVLVSFLELRFLGKMSRLTLREGFLRGDEGALSKPRGPFSRENEAQGMTPKLLALAKVCSVLRNIHDVLWHLSKCGSELEKR